MQTIQDYETELERVNKALMLTKSYKLKNDYTKYKKKLIREIKFYKKNYGKEINYEL